MNRRDAVKVMLGAPLAGAIGTGAQSASAQTVAAQSVTSKDKPFTLPPLGYPYEALEPHIDTATMRIHHSAHHLAYVNNLNALAEKWPELATRPIEELLANLSVAPEEVRTAVRNNLGGHWNHVYFWQLMMPGGAKQPSDEVKSAIDRAFGDVDKMKAAVKQAGLARFGSGWVWLGIGKDKQLTVFSTANQDTPHVYAGGKPILAIDLWEHAYYLKHQSRRADYIDVWWNAVNWDRVAENFKKATA